MNCVTLATKAHALFTILIVSVAIMGTAFAEERTLYTLQADGLACPFCAYGVEKQLSRIDGVDTVSTDIESGTVHLNEARYQAHTRTSCRGCRQSRFHDARFPRAR